ncbi:MAG: ATP phosphoribosyltransferase regulatory subunit, partial [Gammaproteobacteria bacterium]|nr:ATP phosphoribosyltransferase regulatory subunit [Gammaproteobacteria bacterium]
VRGLDYYSHTVFEWVTDQLGAQGTCCAGGRYDSLTEQLGGKLTPAVGWAIGAERILALIENKQGPQPRPETDVYLVLGSDIDALEGLQLAESLREAVPGLALICHSGGGSMKSQFKKADKSGARLAVVLAGQEVADGTATVKYLRDEQEQITVPRDELAQLLINTIQTTTNSIPGVRP